MLWVHGKSLLFYKALSYVIFCFISSFDSSFNGQFNSLYKNESYHLKGIRRYGIYQDSVLYINEKINLFSNVEAQVNLWANIRITMGDATAKAQRIITAITLLAHCNARYALVSGGSLPVKIIINTNFVVTS